MGQMSNEDAARILDPETSREALAPYAHDCQLRLAVTEEACTVAAKVLRGPDVRTNADRIRAMSDEELAQEILRRWRAEMETGKFEDISTRWCDMKGRCVSSKGYHRPCTEDRLLACIKRWLQQPAEEN